MEQALAIMAAADRLDAPVIIQASRGARSYANDIMLRHMMDAVTEIYPNIPVCVHLDHGNEPGTCMTAIQSGFTSVMMDGSLAADGKSPADWDYNVGVTKTVVQMAHLGGISVEGELGVLGSLGQTRSSPLHLLTVLEDTHAGEGRQISHQCRERHPTLQERLPDRLLVEKLGRDRLTRKLCLTDQCHAVADR